MRLLIAYDGSDGAKAAIDDLPFAGLPENSEVNVLAVIDGRTLAKAEAKQVAAGQMDPATPGTMEVCNAVAEEGAERVRGHFPTWTVTAEVCVGAPAWKIIERAETGGGVDLIVLGSRGFGELKRLLFGSVAHHVVTQAKCPVRVGRPRRGPGRGADHPLRIVLGDDGSPDARAALQSVAGRRWPLGTRMLVATFETGVQTRLSNWTPNTVWGGDPVLDSDAAERPAIRVAAQAAELLKAMCRGASVTTLVRPHDPKYGLLDMAETWDGVGADCVFVGATGVRGIERFLVGSVSTTVGLNAPCSVEIVHRRGTGPQR
ncbi:MAG: universal stress protein [Phycisphaerales bacterium]|nr:universal stress protein [Phycisphaerales bacterium]